MGVSRRDFFRLTGVGLLASQTPAAIAMNNRPLSDAEAVSPPFELGVASYTFREFSLEETIDMTRRLGIGNLCLKSMHMPLDLSSAGISSRAALVEEAGIDLYGAGVVYMSSAEEVENAWNYAKHAGLTVIVGVPDHDLLEMCNRKVKETGIRLAIHNHGPGDEKYPSPESVYDRVREMDPGMGLCIDIGHTARIGLDPVRETARFIDRVLDIHIKDVDKPDASGRTLEIGRGIIDIPAYLRMLTEKGYPHIVSFEFEKDAGQPLAGLAESVGYVRGVLDSGV